MCLFGFVDPLQRERDSCQTDWLRYAPMPEGKGGRLETILSQQRRREKVR